MREIIATSNLTKLYGAQTAVQGLEISIPRGAAVGLLGPNGAGKSTTLKMFLGLVRPTSGNVAVLGMDPAREGAAVRARVGYVPEQHHIYGWMTVGEVLRFVRPFYPTWNDRLSEALIRKYALPYEKKVKQLSHGMGTKLSLILALSHEPDVLILDEPTTGLDPLVREEFVESIAELLNDFEKTVVFSSHILSDVERVVDTVAIMCEGKLLTMRPREALLRTTKRVEVTLRAANGVPARPPNAIRAHTHGNVWSVTITDFTDAAAADLGNAPGVESVRVKDITLDEIFKDYVKGYTES